MSGMHISLETLADAGKWLTVGVLLFFSIMNIAVIVERIFFYRNENSASAAAEDRPHGGALHD